LREGGKFPLKEKSMETDPDFIVSLHFSEAARRHLGRAGGPPTPYPQPAGLEHLQHVQAGDFLRIEGMTELWAVQHRVWHLMSDQTVLKLVLDGPIADGE
jgi:hypothetical protein